MRDNTIIFGGRDEVPVSSISWYFTMKMNKRMTEQTKPVTFLKNDVPTDLSTPSWIIVPLPSLCCASPFHNFTCYTAVFSNDTGTRAWAQHFYYLQSCEYLFSWIQRSHAVTLATGYVSVSAGLIIASKDNFRSCLPSLREQDMSLYFLPLNT